MKTKVYRDSRFQERGILVHWQLILSSLGQHLQSIWKLLKGCSTTNEEGPSETVAILSLHMPESAEREGNERGGPNCFSLHVQKFACGRWPLTGRELR